MHARLHSHHLFVAGVEEVGGIGTEKSFSVYRWREVAIAIAASA
jgi:hypothetical protein